MIKATPGHPANSYICFPVIPFPGNRDDDLTDRFFSGLEVVGYAGEKTTSLGSKWVCQCTCGRYEIRRSRPLKNQDPAKSYVCSVCEAERNERQHEVYLRMVG